MKRQLWRDERGVTLLELMTMISILTVLTSIGTVSYGSVREYSRDVKRVADMDVLQGALELYYLDNYSYPPDNGAGGNGLVLGTDQTLALDSRGFVPRAATKVYLQPVAMNPSPGGSDYVYRSFNADGTDCSAPPCARYTVTFWLEGATANMGPGIHTITSEGVDADVFGNPIRISQSELSQAGILAGGLGRAMFFFKEEAAAVVESPTVRQESVAVALPVASGVALLNVFQAAPVTALPRYLLYFFSQPFLLLFRPRRRGFGVVYHALSKLPIDLAVVRLRSAKTGAIVRSAVTDARGRFQFAVPIGSYTIAVEKAGFVFPTRLVADQTTDGAFGDVYHGETIVVRESGTVIGPNIPLDPATNTPTDRRVLRERDWRRVQHGLAVAGLVTALATFVAAPSVGVGAVAAVHIGLYWFFRRLALPKKPQAWGIVYDERGRVPVPRAVVRMFALPYHKMVDSAVTDRRGRYGFLVGPAEVYLTVTKDGYVKTETEPVDLRSTPEAHVIAQDLPLRSTFSK